ncbi:MAG: S-methyl-5'-thioadenosine phosphorylase [Candidatus Dormibacteraeota bacterium]|nr:S-methyl-5'-thioadenosine phosphorylase [Candidatus Dormibacteraeota bacterium]MBO0704061.1 S-methyl-5'-thioadenosine phosphorylase [Candidatus Dormibacteraeota bacterium]MBO0761803.1 S-methyl-5'-thioadenosine phosphorylase [Candidatus Dormibacteraeota bacterium]
MTAAQVTVGVFGGSGFYSFLEGAEFVDVDTPYGKPSDRIAIGDVHGVSVAFLPRHGSQHTLPPSAINYRANLWAMKELGVQRVIAPSTVGALQPHFKLGDFVITDQFVDRTWGREDTYYPRGPVVAHVGAADPYCPVLRQLASECGPAIGVTVHRRGTVVVIQGPRFASRAESRWYSSMGWDVINMTQYPEVILASELELCYLNVGLVTDYDVGLDDDPSIPAVSVAEVERVLASNTERVRRLIFQLIPRLPVERECPCPTAMRGAILGGS